MKLEFRPCKVQTQTCCVSALPFQALAQLSHIVRVHVADREIPQPVLSPALGVEAEPPIWAGIFTQPRRLAVSRITKTEMRCCLTANTNCAAGFCWTNETLPPTRVNCEFSRLGMSTLNGTFP
jgi:hypothetical protein